MILRDSILLQYHLLLTRLGLVNVPSAAPDLAIRLKCLKEWNARWQTLEWGASYSFPLSYNPLWELSGGVFAQGGHTGLFNFRQLMSISSSQDMRQWSIETNVPVRDFGFDHPSELVVLLHEIQPSATNEKLAKGLTGRTFSDNFFIRRNQLAVHLRSLWNGDAHPCAAHSILYHDLTVPYDNESFSYDIQIHAALLVILIHPTPGNLNELVIWNWESGRQLLVCTPLLFECG